MRCVVLVYLVYHYYFWFQHFRNGFFKGYMISMVHQHKNKTKIVYTAYIKGRFVVQIIIKNKL